MIVPSHAILFALVFFFVFVYARMRQRDNTPSLLMARVRQSRLYREVADFLQQ